MAEMDKEFSDGLFFETTECPECGEELTRHQVAGSLSDDAQTFTCPHCHAKIDVGELE